MININNVVHLFVLLAYLIILNFSDVDTEQMTNCIMYLCTYLK